MKPKNKCQRDRAPDKGVRDEHLPTVSRREHLARVSDRAPGKCLLAWCLLTGQHRHGHIGSHVLTCHASVRSQQNLRRRE
ncbi:hypothetical protein EB796_005529 [Bugula neritina]|uniref:Uncharacterized protein n=1 Tax=Bugula neritina TaxID=10212 RepID=A0A7J7KE39_BUGNE|nr:hypothetical protein EB796_005529 [Bugula neritina]